MLRDFKTSWFGRFGSWLTNSATSTKIRENAYFIIIIQYCIVYFALYDTEWYSNNYSLIDIIDTFVMFIALFDALHNKMILKYDDCNLIALFIFLMIIGLNFMISVEVINKYSYLYFYKSTLIIGMVFLLILKIEKYNDKYKKIN